MSMDFLYFPQDKTEYIPSLITLVIFILATAVTLYLFYRKSKKEEALFEEKYGLTKEKKEAKTQRMKE